MAEEEQTVTEEQEGTEEEQALAKLKEAVEVHVEDIGVLRKKLTITVPQATIADRRQNQFSELKRDAVVPGFRKGHAPLQLVEKRFAQDVNEQLSSQLLSSSFLAAVEKVEIKPLGDPLIWARDSQAGADAAERLVSVEEAFDLIPLPATGDLSYSCEVEIRPEIPLPELEGIPIEQPQVKLGKTEVNAYLDRLRAMRGHYEPVPNDKIREDDLVVCNIKVTVGTEVLLTEENCQLAVRPQRYSGLLFEDLHSALEGAKVGDHKTVPAKVPDDYEDERYRGKDAEAQIELLDLKRLSLPELDEDFLSGMGFESRQELEDWALSNLKARSSEELRRLQRHQVSKYLLDNTPTELPERLSQQQADRIAIRRMLELAHRGMPDSEIEKQADAIRVGAQEDAMQDLKLQFILEKIADEWEVQVSEDEINGQIAAIAQRQNRRFDRVRDELIRNKSTTALYVQVRDDKIMDRLIEQAKIVEKTEKPKSKGQKATRSSEKKSTASRSKPATTAKKTTRKKTTKKAAKSPKKTGGS